MVARVRDDVLNQAVRPGPTREIRHDRHGARSHEQIIELDAEVEMIRALAEFLPDVFDFWPRRERHIRRVEVLIE